MLINLAGRCLELELISGIIVLSLLEIEKLISISEHLAQGFVLFYTLPKTLVQSCHENIAFDEVLKYAYMNIYTIKAHYYVESELMN